MPLSSREKLVHDTEALARFVEKVARHRKNPDSDTEALARITEEFVQTVFEVSVRDTEALAREDKKLARDREELLRDREELVRAIKTHARNIEILAHEIHHHRAQYYHGSAPEISDKTYDELEGVYAGLLKKIPASSAPEDNPLDHIGTLAINTGFTRRKHRQIMGSLEKVRSEAEYADFIRGVERFLCLESPPVMNLEPKLDGLSASLTYEDGHLVQALTRGDGTYGEDVTANMRRVGDVPHRLRDEAAPRLIEIRGEVLIKRADFSRLNSDLKKAGEKEFVSCRNAAAGSLRQTDPEITGSRSLVFRAFSLGYMSSRIVAKHAHLARLFTSWGLTIAEPWLQSDSMADVAAYVNDIETKRGDYIFDLDGVVCKVDDVPLQERLGMAGRSPRWAVAWKFHAHAVETRLRKITFQVSRLGHLTPVAILEPTKVDGVTINRASLHNVDEIERKDVRPGDWVMLQRSGDVIPQITGVNISRRPAQSIAFVLPTNCPSCGSNLTRNGGFLECDQGLDCPDQRFEALRHVVSRPALDIRGFGSEHLKLFISHGWLTQPADLFRLHDHKEAIVALQGWGKKSWDNLEAELDRSRRQTLDRAFYCLGIPKFGSELTRRLAHIFDDYGALRRFALQSPDDSPQSIVLTQHDGFGDKNVEAIRSFFGDKRRRDQSDALIAILAIDAAPRIVADSLTALTGKAVLFSGGLSISRQEAKTISERAGARVVTSISRQVDFLVLGDDAGGKKKKAAELGIPVLDEAGWRSMLEEGVSS